MKHFLFVFISLLFITVSPPSFARVFRSEQIKNYVDNTPRKVENYLPSLTAYLVKPFDNDYDKAKAIAFWIASRISYDEYLYSSGKTSRLINSYNGQSPSKIIKSRVGICGDFARLFDDMCKKAGIKSRIVHGYVYPKSKYTPTRKILINSGHAWNYFVYKGNKVYVDTTWMSKGSTGVKGIQNEQNRRRALNQIARNNKLRSKSHRVDDYYFDFSYKDEIKKRGYVHKER